MNVDAIVLAGGASTRFGADKLAVELDGQPVLHHALTACAAVAGRLVLVLAPGAPVPRLPAALSARVVVVRDPVPHAGPLAGLAAGIDLLADAELVLAVGGDMPWLVPAVLQLLIDRLAADPRTVVVELEADPRATLPMAMRPGRAGPAARTLLAEGRGSLRGLTDRVPSAVVAAARWRALDADGRTLVDIDTPADLRALRSRR